MLGFVTSTQPTQLTQIIYSGQLNSYPLMSNQNSYSNIPNSWMWCYISDVGKVVTGTTPKKSESKYYGGDILFFKPTELNQGYYVKSSIDRLTEEGLRKTRFIPERSILVTCIGATIGKTGFSRFSGACNQQINAIIPYREIHSEFIYFACISPSFQKSLKSSAASTTLPILNKSKFEALRIPLPPLAEQRRIVDKIEELFSDLDSGIASLKTAQQQLKVYRQAVLKWAFEGKLTAEWREEQQRQGTLESAETLLSQIKAERERRYEEALATWKAAVKTWEENGKEGKKPSKPRAFKEIIPFFEQDLGDILPKISKSWMYCPIDLFLSLNRKGMTTGPFGTMLKKNEHQKYGVPVLGIENIGNGKFQNGNKIFVTDEKAQSLSSFKVEGGDIIISRSGTVGEICSIPDKISGALISTNLIRVSLNKNIIHPKYFVYLFQGGGTVKEQVKELCKGSTRDFLNQTILRSIKFPLPSFQEQVVIVEEIESRLSICDKLEADIEINLKKAEALRQSILKQAFEGKLVPQDPKDEPASVLLERIREEREK